MIQIRKAIADEKLRKQMQVEDDVLEEFKAYTRTIAEQEKALEEKNEQLNKQNLIITKSILKFHALNMNAETIAETLDISVEQVNQILSKIQ